MADIHIVRKGTTTNKLTIAKDRVELKLTDQVSPEGEQWLNSFSQKVVEEVAKNPSEFTLRGRFRRHDNQKQIALALGWGIRGQKEPRHFYSDKMGMPSPPEDVR